jgi:pyrimidine-specific ribonucleoside hydrolase
MRIAGISTTYGNARLAVTDRVARDLAQRFGEPAGITQQNVYAGAKSQRDLGTKTDATRGLARALANERNITFIALGPLTNLATLVLRYPELASRIGEVIFVGGRSPGANLVFASIRIHDANVIKDEAAVQVLLRSQIPIRLIPPETGLRFVVNRGDMWALGASGVAGNYLFRNSRAWLWWWTVIMRHDGGPLFDALAICAAHPDELTWETRYAALDRNGDLVATPTRGSGARRVLFCSGFRPRTKPIMTARLSGR